MSHNAEKYNRLIKQALNALNHGDKLVARTLAEKAIKESPGKEEAWLILAALATPDASIHYAKKALEINPKSTRARQAIKWALRRKRFNKTTSTKRILVNRRLAGDAYHTRKHFLAPYGMILAAILFIITFWLSHPAITLADDTQNGLNSLANQAPKATLTYTPTPTFTPTYTPTPTFTPSPTPTNTPTPTSTPTLPPTLIPTWTPQTPNDPIDPPDAIRKGERWIDINLSKQMLYAYQGKNLVGSFVVSTGVWNHPTVVGQYHIYVKYRYADMSGPGYYLPNVPYVMYFYKGYGIHGTYWHHNFGTPMSHGCINMKTDEAGWIYNWSSIGTLVNIHY